LFSQNKLATSNQPAVLFSHNKPAPGISHQPNEQADVAALAPAQKIYIYAAVPLSQSFENTYI
jgi:acetylornithine deacetylase/succinyl-diaminopimelate desuccinylase-like protein